MSKPHRPRAERTRVAGDQMPAPGVDLNSPDTASSADLPHERDEAVGATGGIQSERIQQAHRDRQRGVQDTSRAPEADRAYQKQKR
jgi:hypothetical protein